MIFKIIGLLMACQENHSISSPLYVSEIRFSAATDLSVVPHLRFGQAHWAGRRKDAAVKPVQSGNAEQDTPSAGGRSLNGAHLSQRLVGRVSLLLRHRNVRAI